VLKDQEDQLGSGVRFCVHHGLDCTRTSENGNQYLTGRMENYSVRLPFWPDMI
jgi:hypothetical protein